LFHFASILVVLNLATDAEEVITAGATIVPWTYTESGTRLQQEGSFSSNNDSGTGTPFDAGFHHRILPGLETDQSNEEAVIRYEPEEVKTEVGWEAVSNMQSAGDGSEPLPVFDAEWGAELQGACDCWNTTEDGRDVEVECRCGGLELADIPSNLASNVHRM
jgi:hypothetical protein